MKVASAPIDEPRLATDLYCAAMQEELRLLMINPGTQKGPALPKESGAKMRKETPKEG